MVIDVKTVCAVSVKEEACVNSSYDVKDRLQWEFV